MGNLINKHLVIDPNTGVVLKERNWSGYDGFTKRRIRIQS